VVPDYSYCCKLAAHYQQLPGSAWVGNINILFYIKDNRSYSLLKEVKTNKNGLKKVRKIMMTAILQPNSNLHSNEIACQQCHSCCKSCIGFNLLLASLFVNASTVPDHGCRQVAINSARM